MTYLQKIRARISNCHRLMYLNSVILLFVVLVVAGETARFPKTGEIVYKKVHLQDGNYEFEVTDGKVLLKAITSVKDGIQSCTLKHDYTSILNLLLENSSVRSDIGEFAVKDMIEHCQTLDRKKKSLDDNLTEVPFSPEETGKPEGPSGSFAIFPGTKWCGYENIAKNESDLGEHRATDSCCRTHDHCPYFIDRWQTKYNYRNPYPWTLSYCGCDNALYNCLKSVQTTASNEVGELFFGVLSVKCFEFKEGTYCEERHWSNLWCVKKAKGYKAVAEKFPHTWGDKYNASATTASPSLVG